MGPALPSRRRYVIIGAGAVGAALAAGWEDAGVPAVLVSRGASLDAVRERGLRVRHAGAERTLGVDTVGGPDEVGLGVDDVLVFTVKTQDAAGALARWSALPVDGAQHETATAGRALTVVTVQNGLEAERVALRHFSRVVAATTLIAARHVVPGEIDIAGHGPYGRFVLGAFPSAVLAPDAAAVVRGIADDIRAANWVVDETDEPASWKAWKTAQASAFAVEVLDGTTGERDALRTRVRDEAERVLRTAGYRLAEPAFARRASSGAPASQLSTWQSFARGSSSEVDHLAGEVVLRARLHGVPAPYSESLQQILALSSAAGEGPGSRTVAQVNALAEARRSAVSHPEPTGVST